jgi:Asp-tRNA(Asn)/Glu-tRNA(Gln) amidotransferase A subunit family amidase
MDPAYLDMLEVGSLIRSRRVTAAEIVLAQIQRIERLAPKLWAFSRFEPERALERARLMDAEIEAAIGLGVQSSTLL